MIRHLVIQKVVQGKRGNEDFWGFEVKSERRESLTVFFLEV